jgi:CRP-like cAMP-binding protein
VSDLEVLERFAVEYEAGAVLFREGDEGAEMFVIQDGSVEILRRIADHDRTLAVLNAGEFFGEMALVNDRPRSATAVVREPSRLLLIDSSTFEAMLRGKPEIAVRILKTMAARLERANQQIELLLLQDANHRVVQCLRQTAEECMPTGRGAVYLAMTPADIAQRVALPEPSVRAIVDRLAQAHLVMKAADAGVTGEGYVLPEVGRLLEFLEFLELKERYQD